MSMFDMMGMMGKVKDMQARMKEVKENVVHLTAEAESGAGMVKVKVNGIKQLISIDIDPSLLKESDRTVVQDLVVAAVNKAMTDIDVKVQEEFKEKTKGLLPTIPGMDLGSMFGM